MKKAVTKPQGRTKQENLLGENIVLTLTVPWKDLDTEYQKLLREEAGKITLKGFRKGKAPLSLAEATLGREKLMEHALNHVLPSIYEQEVIKAKINPLVRPEIKAKETSEGKNWTLEAATAIAPEVKLGDYKQLIKQGAAKYAKKLSEQKDAKESEDELLQTIFVTLIEAIKPKVAPLLLQEEMNQQLHQLYEQLQTRKIELADYIKAQGKTEEQFRTDLAALALGALQLEFVLQEITEDLKLAIDENEVKAWMKSQGYPENTKLPDDLRVRLVATLLRRKTTQEIAAMAKA